MSGIYTTGLDALLAKFDALIEGADEATKAGALNGAEIVADRARELAPEKTGAMAGHIVALPTNEGAEVVATMPYTSIQEFDDTLNHPNGGQAHFLGQAVAECRELVTGEIAKSLTANIATIAGGG